MRLRRTLSENKEQGEAKYDDAWIPLADLGDLSSLAYQHKVNRDFSSSILAGKKGTGMGAQATAWLIEQRSTVMGIDHVGMGLTLPPSNFAGQGAK
ncbi:MAG: hypothetical protein ACJAYF_000761 [Arenicella sp.]|jgi:hypothetical protein